jgi:large subunit ribosomal protein L17
MVTSLLEHERIYTTVPKAKEIRRWTDSMITLGKRGDLHARRQALAVVRSKAVVHKLFAELGPRYQDRPGGYTRIVKMGYRRGDAAPMCLIELVGGEVQKAKKPVKLDKAAEESRPKAAAEGAGAEAEAQGGADKESE